MMHKDTRSLGGAADSPGEERYRDSRMVVFVCSCDATQDVAAHMIASLRAFMPPAADVQVYVGCNTLPGEGESSNIRYVSAPSGDWRSETIVQLRALLEREPGVTHVLVLLDDFILFKPANRSALVRLYSAAVENGINYVGVTSGREAAVTRVIQKLGRRRKLGGQVIVPIRPSHPYYFSLQAAVWKLDYLQRYVEAAADIWGFERLPMREAPHYHVDRSILHYRHVVEKGQWDLGAEKFCVRAIGWFEPGSRAHRNGKWLRASRIGKRLSRLIFGFGLARARATLYSSRRSSVPES